MPEAFKVTNCDLKESPILESQIELAFSGAAGNIKLLNLMDSAVNPPIEVFVIAYSFV